MTKSEARMTAGADDHMADPFTIAPACPAEFLEVAALDRIAWPVVPDTFIPDGEHVWRVWCEHAVVLVARRPAAPAAGTSLESGQGSQADESGAVSVRSGGFQPPLGGVSSQGAAAGSRRYEPPAVVGALVMFPTRDGELFLHKIMVHSDWRGRGVGTALMRAALERAEAPVLLTVDPANAAAVRLYENMGFRIREHVAGYYRPHEHRYVMVCDPNPNVEIRMSKE
ncbi:MAG TPA: N-acetyltransferase [Planctomycetaceae bacterium]|nr:N-acetyltransferase [Planctomycetaceae bacterium]